MLLAILCLQSAPRFLAHEIFILYAYRSPSIKVTFGVASTRSNRHTLLL